MNEEKRKAYLDKVEAQFHEWDAELTLLEAKADRTKAEAKVKYLEEIERLKANRQELKEKVRKLKESGSEAWDDVKTGLESSWNELKAGLKNALDAFKTDQE